MHAQRRGKRALAGQTAPDLRLMQSGQYWRDDDGNDRNA
jgi:hypothetical protein